MKTKQKPTLGSALILTTILLFVILGMVVSLTYVTVMEQKMSGKTKSSVGSFYNAESGVEWILNKIASSSGEIGDNLTLNSDSSISCPPSFGDNECKVYLLDQNGDVIQDSSVQLSEVKAVRSVGSQGQETQRAIEAAVGGTGGGSCYTCYNGSDISDCCDPSFKSAVVKIGTWYNCSYHQPAAYFSGVTISYPGAPCWSHAALTSSEGGVAYACCK
jgi:hypothetical protein